MAPAGHFGPSVNVVGALTPLPGREADLLGKYSHRRRYRNSFALLHVPWMPGGFIVETGGGVDYLSHPIDGDSSQKLIFGIISGIAMYFKNLQNELQFFFVLRSR